MLLLHVYYRGFHVWNGDYKNKLNKRSLCMDILVVFHACLNWKLFSTLVPDFIIYSLLVLYHKDILKPPHSNLDFVYNYFGSLIGKWKKYLILLQIESPNPASLLQIKCKLLWVSLAGAYLSYWCFHPHL